MMTMARQDEWRWVDALALQFNEFSLLASSGTLSDVAFPLGKVLIFYSAILVDDR